MDIRSKLFRSTGLLALLFSCPPATTDNVDGVIFPVSDVELRARFMGLRGEVRVREDERVGVAFVREPDRNANFALGGNGTARGEGV